jgi:hypothetical protein
MQFKKLCYELDITIEHPSPLMEGVAKIDLVENGKENIYLVSVAATSELDNFCKKEGRKGAEIRLDKLKQFLNIICPNRLCTIRSIESTINVADIIKYCGENVYNQVKELESNESSFAFHTKDIVVMSTAEFRDCKFTPLSFIVAYLPFPSAILNFLNIPKTNGYNFMFRSSFLTSLFQCIYPHSIETEKVMS